MPQTGAAHVGAVEMRAAQIAAYHDRAFKDRALETRPVEVGVRHVDVAQDREHEVATFVNGAGKRTVAGRKPERVGVVLGIV